jgi:hypothetical protein
MGQTHLGMGGIDVSRSCYISSKEIIEKDIISGRKSKNICYDK